MKKVTIREVANEAGVSIATVSHVINKTRYVRQELIDKVEKAIKSTGYQYTIQHKNSTLVVNGKMMVAIIIPEINGAFYQRLIMSLSNYLDKHGYIVSVYITNGDTSRERNIYSTLRKQQAICGMIICPFDIKSNIYNKLSEYQLPIVSIGRNLVSQNITSVNFDVEMISYIGVKHLIQKGHEKILMLVDSREPESVIEERKNGFMRAFQEVDLKAKTECMLLCDLDSPMSKIEKQITNGLRQLHSTGVFASGNRLTLILLKTLKILDLEWPKDISVVGFEDNEWNGLLDVPITTIHEDIELMARKAVDCITKKEQETTSINIPVDIEERESTQMIGKGAFGELAVSPDLLTFSDAEKETLKLSHFHVGISFHYGNTAWYNLHEKGIRDTLSELGIIVTSVMDANFDPDLQILQLEGLRKQKVDAVIAIPVNDEITAHEFKRLSRETKLIFLSNVPKGIGRDEYGTCVSVNEQENGRNAGLILERHYHERDKVKIGLMTHGTPFYGTQLRDISAKETIKQFSNLEIVCEEPFYKIENAYQVCEKMIKEHPDIEAMYITWDEPALRAMKALTEMGRTDVKIVTTDLDTEIAGYLAQGKMVIGLSTQRPYEQGVAAAKALAKVLLGKGKGAKYVAVSPYIVNSDNLIKAWREIFHEKLPEELFQMEINYLRK